MADVCAHEAHRDGVEVDLTPLRLGGAVMLVAAAAWRVLPVHPVLLCPLRSVTGVPCPFCGMTRAVVSLVHGDVLASLAFNPGGLAVVGLAVALLVTWRWRRVVIPVWGVVGGFAVLWAYQLFKYTTGRPL